jgi:hypothetical protein
VKKYYVVVVAAAAAVVVEVEAAVAVVVVVLSIVHRLLVTANVPSSPILVTLMMEVLLSSETSVLTRAMWHNIPEDGILLVAIHIAECCKLLHAHSVLEPLGHVGCWDTQHHLVYPTNKNHRDLHLGIKGATSPC